ncbi:MAG: RsmE family RNA methyltransferase [Verrucomicrobiota bacterium]
MHRFYCPDPESGLLDAAESHHARSVLRIKVGERCAVFDGKGKEVQAKVTEVGKHQLSFNVLSCQQSQPLPFSIHLIQALTKGKSWSLILEKSTELGVSSILPVLSDRSVTRISPEDSGKQEKWRQEIIAACKQSGRNYLPRLSPVTTISQLDGCLPAPEAPKFIASLQPGALPLGQALDQALASGAHTDITIAVGPEGDFSPAELGEFHAEGYQPVTLGPNVLRAETAAIYLCAVLFHEMQHRL